VVVDSLILRMKKILFPIFVLVLVSVEVSSRPFSEEARLFDHFENIHLAHVLTRGPLTKSQGTTKNGN